MKRMLAVALFSTAMMVVLSVRAEDKIADVTDMDALRNAVRTDKKAFVASTLKLTDAEAKKFWPIYDAYQGDLEVINRRRTRAFEGLIGQERNLSNAYARTLANELISTDEAEIKLRRALHNRLLSRTPGRVVMPAVKAARYLQLESKIRAYQDYDIAVTFPLVR